MIRRAAGALPQPRGRSIRLVCALLVVQGMGFGCGGILLLIYAVVVLALALTAGLQYLVLAVAAAVVAAALSAFAVALWLLARGLRWRGKQWAQMVVAAEIVLAPTGAILFWLESQAQTTDNPFSEGGAGFIALFGFVLGASGTVALAALLWGHASRHLR